MSSVILSSSHAPSLHCAATDHRNRLVIVDHIKQRFARVWPEMTPEKSLNKAIDSMMGSSMPKMNWWSRDVTFTPEVSWWNKEPVRETVCGREAQIFKMENLKVRPGCPCPRAMGSDMLTTRTRTHHIV
jgi:hypothetical protein